MPYFVMTLFWVGGWGFFSGAWLDFALSPLVRLNLSRTRSCSLELCFRIYRSLPDFKYQWWGGGETEAYERLDLASRFTFRNLQFSGRLNILFCVKKSDAT